MRRVPRGGGRAAGSLEVTPRAGAPSGGPLPEVPESVAVVLLSAIGDVVHGMPVVSSLRRAWPEARVDWVIQRRILPLVAPHPAVDDFLVFRRDAGLWGFLDFWRRHGRRRYDLVVDLQVYFKAGVLTAMLGAPVKLGFDRARSADLNGLFVTHRIPARPVQHVQDQYFEFLEHLDVPPRAVWDFAFSPEERRARNAFFRRIGGPALGVVLRATGPERNWAPRRYARVLEAAEVDLGLRPVLVGSAAPEERAVAEEVKRLTRASPVDALADDLRRLAWLLEGCALAVSPDTGPLHVASAVGTPVVGLYGATDPRVKGPYRPEFRKLAVDRFTRPGDDPPTLERRPGHMERITVEEVVEKLELAAARHL